MITNLPITLFNFFINILLSLINYSEFICFFFGISLNYSAVSLITRPKCGRIQKKFRKIFSPGKTKFHLVKQFYDKFLNFEKQFAPQIRTNKGIYLIIFDDNKFTNHSIYFFL